MRHLRDQRYRDEDQQPVDRRPQPSRPTRHWSPLSGHGVATRRYGCVLQPRRPVIVAVLQAKEKDLGDDLLFQTVAGPFCRQKKKTSALTYSSRPLPARFAGKRKRPR